MRRWIAAALVVTGAMGMGLGGCTQAVEEKPLVASAHSPVADVPIPAKFYMTSQSRSSLAAGTGVRMVEHYYKGKGGFLPVVQFYRTQLPPKGWSLVSQQQAGNHVTLTCSKGNEDMTLTIWDGTFDTHIEAQIYPASRGASN